VKTALRHLPAKACRCLSRRRPIINLWSSIRRGKGVLPTFTPGAPTSGMPRLRANAALHKARPESDGTREVAACASVSPQHLMTLTNFSEHGKSNQYAMNGQAPMSTLHSPIRIGNASKANVPMLMASLCALAAPFVLVAIAWFVGKLAVTEVLRLLGA